MSRAVKPVAGLVVVLAVVAAYLVIHNSAAPGYRVTVMMADAGGLQSGSNVNVNGVTVGKVTSLKVNAADRAVAGLTLNRSAAPIGSGATASVEIDGFFGERILDLTRGDYTAHPEASGATIPVSHSSVSVRLDDVLDSLNMDAEGSLQTFLDEDGTALVGRGQDLRELLTQLPQTLPQLTTLLDDFSANQQALGQLVDRSSQVVSQVAGQRRYLASLVNRGNSALSALASRRDQLGSTVQRAPGTLAQVKTTLARLQGTAIPLAPAADGLRATAPSLLTALHRIPSFTSAAVPTLNEVATVAPALDTLAASGTPIVQKVVPLAHTLTGYSSSALSPLLTMLDQQGGAENFIGEMEGWARSTQGYDAAGHVFRFGATVGSSTFTQLLDELGIPSTTPASSTSQPAGPAPAAKPVSTKGSVGGTVASTVSSVGSGVQGLVSSVGNGVASTVNQLTGTVGGIVTKLHGSGSSTGAATTTTNSSNLSSLLGYLLGK